MSFKDIDLIWNTEEYKCKTIIGTPQPCIMSTSMIACMPQVCTAADVELVGEMETGQLCPELAPKYNLSNCTVRFVEPKN